MAKVAQIKTKETEASIEEFINALTDETKREDSLRIIKMMSKATKSKPKLWGSSIIGFGNKRYVSPNTKREVDWFIIGFSPRKANFSLYIMLDNQTREKYLKKLGKYKSGGGCIYINKLIDIDLKVLEDLISVAVSKK
jgi:hypothetical protein